MLLQASCLSTSVTKAGKKKEQGLSSVNYIFISASKGSLQGEAKEAPLGASSHGPHQLSEKVYRLVTFFSVYLKSTCLLGSYVFCIK